MKTARNVIALAHAASAAAFLYAVPIHLSDPAWPPHAKNHALQALFWIVGFHGVAIAIAWIPFYRREKWAWWASLAAALSIFGGYFAGIAVTGGGAPGPADDGFFGILFVLNLFGLFLARYPRESVP